MICDCVVYGFSMIAYASGVCLLYVCCLSVFGVCNVCVFVCLCVLCGYVFVWLYDVSMCCVLWCLSVRVCVCV